MMIRKPDQKQQVDYYYSDGSIATVIEDDPDEYVLHVSTADGEVGSLKLTPGDTMSTTATYEPYTAGQSISINGGGSYILKGSTINDVAIDGTTIVRGSDERVKQLEEEVRELKELVKTLMNE